MSRSPKSDRPAGVGLTVASLVSVQIAYVSTAGFSDLEASAPMMLGGGLALAAAVLVKSRFKLGRFSRMDKWYVLRLTIGNAVLAYSYLKAGHMTTFAITATAYTLGTLSVGLKEIWRLCSTPWGLKNLGGRVLVVAGAVWLSGFGYEVKPGTGGDASAGISYLGYFWAAVTAWCAWNVVRVNTVMTSRGLADQCAAIANLAAAPVLFVLVFALQGVHWMSPKLLLVTSLAGVLAVCVPVLLLNSAIRRLSGRDVGVLLSLGAPVAALVALVGAGIGWREPELRTTPQGWLAMCLIAGAAAAVSMIPKPVAGRLPEPTIDGVAERH